MTTIELIHVVLSNETILLQLELIRELNGILLVITTH